MDQSGLTSSEQQPEKCYLTTTPNQQPPHQTPVLESQPGTQQQLQPGNTLCPT